MRNAHSHPIVRAALATVLLATSAGAQLRREGITSLTDAEFWRMFTTMSETGGSFPSENFVSNEMTYQHVIPTLQKTVRPDGVYLGVGPEQNFTYIANLKPRLAIIFDIRRQNAMAHLMYKALFEMSPTRAEFVGRLFSRPLASRVGPGAKVVDLFAVATAAQRSDSAYAANQKAIFANLVDTHHFVLTPGDSAAIEHLLEVFYEAGPEVNYGYRLGRPGTSYSPYPTYATLQGLANADSVQMAFLASEENYRAVRDMQVRNLIVPVVGDFAGPKAIRAVGDYLKQRSLTVQAFYLSNVEQYLFQNGVAEAFYQNVATLPVDSTSTFIRSVPPGAWGAPFVGSSRAFVPGLGGGYSGSMRITFNGTVTSAIQTFDSAGMHWMRSVNDSGGIAVARLYRDSVGVLQLQRTDTIRTAPGSGSVPIPNGFTPAPNIARMPVISPGRTGSTFIVGGGLLASGIAPIRTTLFEFSAGRILSYGDVIGMTKLDGWK